MEELIVSEYDGKEYDGMDIYATECEPRNTGKLMKLLNEKLPMGKEVYVVSLFHDALTVYEH